MRKQRFAKDSTNGLAFPLKLSRKPMNNKGVAMHSNLSQSMHSARLNTANQVSARSLRYSFTDFGFDKSTSTYTTKNYAAKALRGTWSSIG